jgi:hypothetical protein
MLNAPLSSTANGVGRIRFHFNAQAQLNDIRGVD